MINFNLWPQCDPSLAGLPDLTWEEKIMFELDHEYDPFDWVRHIIWPSPNLVEPDPRPYFPSGITS